MKGSELRLIEYMEGSKKRFIIPVYQRNYDWKIENCKQLYDDLIQVIKNNSKTHFFGSIVSVYEPSGRNTEFLIIDGQQRLTTMSLLFLAMYNLLEEKIIISEDESLKDQIYEDFLVDKYQPQEKRMKLKPIKNDQKAFSKLFNSKDDYIKEVKKLGIEDKVVFIGSKINPYPYMKRADYLILTSNYEGFPVVYLEGLALKKKLITTIKVSDDAIKIGKNYGEVIPTNEKKMLEQVREILNSKDKKDISLDLEEIQNMRMKKLETIFDGGDF